MIYRVSSSLPTFKTLNFLPGLNILIAKKEEKSSNKQTRNRAGKSSLIEIIHFLTGARVDKNSLFKSKALENVSFEMTFEADDEIITVQRSCKNQEKVHIDFLSGEIKDISNSEWISFLGNRMFGLSERKKISVILRHLDHCFPILYVANQVVHLPHPRNRLISNNPMITRLHSCSFWDLTGK